MNKIVTTLLISSLALAGFSVANADDDRYERGERYEHGGHHGKYCNKHGMKGQRLEHMIEHLGLSDEQATKVRSIRDEYMPRQQALRTKMQATRQQLREVMHADAIDQDQVKQLSRAMGDLKADKIMLHAQMRGKIHEVLTTKQREKMKTWKQQRGYKHMHGDRD